jgi:hemin uptake protein HemP
MKNYLNIFIIIIILIQIIYIFFNATELFSEKIDYIISHEGNIYIKIITIIIMILIFIPLHYLIIFFSKKYKINKFILYIFIILTIMIIIEYKLSTNKYLSNIECDIDEILEKSTTGDFLLFRSYHTYDIPELLFYRYFNALSSKYFFGHIGIIIKKNGVPYIMESTEDYYNCEINKKNKNGFIFHKAYDRIKSYSGTVYISRNNLDQYINDYNLKSFINKYKDIYFLENNIGCVNFIILFLYECNLLKHNYKLLSPYNITLNNIYKIDYKCIENIKIKNDYIINNDL